MPGSRRRLSARSASRACWPISTGLVLARWPSSPRSSRSDGGLMTHKTLRGTIRYTSAKPERLGQERGREYFMFTDEADGVRVVHAHCEIDDAPNVIRDVVMSLDREWYPIDCSVRLTVGDRHEGTGLMHFSNTLAECDTVNRSAGRITQRIELTERVRWLGAHPICGDALCLRIFDLSKGPGRQFFPHLMLTSPVIAARPGRCCSRWASASSSWVANRSSWLPGRSMPFISDTWIPPDSCPKSIRRMTCGVPTTTTTSFSRAASGATCKPATN